MLIDLQLHSTYSDGYLTPTQVVKFILGEGVKVASLTDHNTVGGLDEFRQACQKYRIKPIIGIELYVKLRSAKFGILWFNFNDKDPELHDLLRQSQLRRRNQVRLILEKLKKRRFKIDINRILDKYNHYVPINHIVDEINSVAGNRFKIAKELGIKKPKEREIIHKYFRDKKVGILRASYIDLNRIIKLRKKIGGQLILNHPGKHNRLNREFFKNIKRIGIDGIEVFSPHHSVNIIMYAKYLAKEFGFIETGGSDFHRPEGDNYSLQHAWQYFKIDSKYLSGIRKIIG